MRIETTLFGYPKIGPRRELKTAVESFWEEKISKDELLSRCEALNLERLGRLSNGKIDFLPVNDFSLYDSMLDLSTMFGAIPQRFRGIDDDLTRYFAMARGHDDAAACEMTKWFDTNYHYIVPELDGQFSLAKNRPLESYRRAERQFGGKLKPVIIGPFTYIYLGKIFTPQKQSDVLDIVKAPESARFRDLVLSLAPFYNRILSELQTAGARIVQIDEPALVYDLNDAQVDTLIDAYRIIMKGIGSLQVFVHTYYESLSAYQKVTSELPVSGIGLDFVVNEENYHNLQTYGFPKGKKLLAGILAGRSPWKSDIGKVVGLVNDLATLVGEENLILSNAAPLYHLPVSLEPEREHLDAAVLQMLSFADERVEEMTLIREIVNEGRPVPAQDLKSFSGLHENGAIRKAVAGISDKAVRRPHPFKKRYAKQMERLNLPQLPTSTVGSFPQTAEVRKKRAGLLSGSITGKEYDAFVREKITDLVKLQEEIGIDVLVHGEFERTDMVEYFGQKMKGFAFTKNGWVQSYGSRCVRPPLIYGDVSRPEPMTLKESIFAQSLTSRPVKGMLTGPVTILNWSFQRDDIPKKEIAYQIALALKDEVSDLEKSGIRIIQIDEPAFREGLPLKKAKQKEYLAWAITAFRLTNAHVREETQIHAHMCYSEFDEIIDSIHAMDADVMLIEGARNRGEILRAFGAFKYDLGIGIGVYDVHSPHVPGEREIEAIVARAQDTIKEGIFWINPDCGLKTRSFEEVVPSLRNMVAVSHEMRRVTASAHR